MTATPANTRTAVFVTHAAPEDNEFALWLSSKLAMAGYRVWVDRQRLRGGTDTWDDIDHVLRNDAAKQIVVFTKNTGKPGVKKELAIGDVVRKKIPDPSFIIPIRADDISFCNAPPEFLRANIIDGYPNWHDCLAELFETLDEAGVPKNPSPDAATLKTIVDAREDGRRFIVDRPEQALTNWFPATPPKYVRYYRFEGIRTRSRSGWLIAGFPAWPRDAWQGVSPIRRAFSTAARSNRACR